MLKWDINQGNYLMEKFTYKILDSISRIDKAQWDGLFGEMPQGYGFYRVIEESKLEGFSFYYISLYKNSEMVLIAPVFISDFNLDIGVEGKTRYLIRFIRKFVKRFLITRALFCGSPITENAVIGIKSGIENRHAVITELTKVIDILCKEKRIPLVLFKDFLKKDLHLLEPLKKNRFFSVESFPSVIVELPFNSMDDYFQSLSSNTRKDIRRKIKKAGGKIKVIITSNIENIIADVYALYLNSYNAGPVKLEKLTKEFFINMGNNLGEQAKFFLYYLDEQLVAFNFGITAKDILIDMFIGFNYDIAYKYNLYFYSWCYNVEWCLKNSIKYYQVGQTDYHPKIRLGGKLIPLFAYIKHNNFMLNSLYRLLAKFLVPANFDKNIKPRQSSAKTETAHRFKAVNPND